jgi:predicted AlkP superfamily phosphohydrolase/phosphomutase
MGKKIYLIGMDGFIVPMARRFAAEGALPNISWLIENGSANQTYPSLPVWTPTNWATLATGADTGTHGATRWHVDRPDGERLSCFDSRAVAAETIWEALERASLKSVSFHYPAAMPSRLKEGYAVDGFGHPGAGQTPYEIAPPGAYLLHPEGTGQQGAEMAHDGSLLRAGETPRSIGDYIVDLGALEKASGWEGLPSDSVPPLAATIEILPKWPGDPVRFRLLVVDSVGKGYDRVMLCENRDSRSAFADLGIGAWSDWRFQAFTVGGERQQGTVRFKLIELAPDASRLKLYRSQVMRTDGFTHPQDLAGELIERFGPYPEHCSLTPYQSGMADLGTALEELEYQAQWIARAGVYVMKERECSLFNCHWHIFDHLNHPFLGKVDPGCPAHREEEVETYLEYFREGYRIADRMVATVREGADEETYVGIISDHGAVADRRIVNIRKFLYVKGFLSVKPSALPELEQDQVAEDDIDWTRTVAYMKDGKGFDIFIRAEGECYERVQRDLLRELRTWVDEETGRCPVAVALPKEDAYLFGQWGSQVGDVVFMWDSGYASGYYGAWKSMVGGDYVGAPEEYGGHHGGIMPTTQTEITSNLGTFFLAGPGIKRGYERPVERLGYIRAMDVVPTVCHILEVHPPAHSQGAVAYDMFEEDET